MNIPLRVSTFLREFLPVLGAVVLFGAWSLQQSVLQRSATEMQKLSQAVSVYQTYQSNNALFNAVVQLVSEKPLVVNEIRRFQTYNYELGLRAMEDSLSEAERRDIPAPAFPYGSSGIAAEMERTQKRLEALQTRVHDRQAALAAQNRALNYVFLSLYGAGSCAILIGSYLKAMSAVRKEQIDASVVRTEQSRPA